MKILNSNKYIRRAKEVTSNWSLESYYEVQNRPNPALTKSPQKPEPLKIIIETEPKQVRPHISEKIKKLLSNLCTSLIGERETFFIEEPLFHSNTNPPPIGQPPSRIELLRWINSWVPELPIQIVYLRNFSLEDTKPWLPIDSFADLLISSGKFSPEIALNPLSIGQFDSTIISKYLVKLSKSVFAQGVLTNRQFSRIKIQFNLILDSIPNNFPNREELISMVKAIINDWKE